VFLVFFSKCLKKSKFILNFLVKWLGLQKRNDKNKRNELGQQNQILRIQLVTGAAIHIARISFSIQHPLGKNACGFIGTYTVLNFITVRIAFERVALFLLRVDLASALANRELMAVYLADRCCG